MADAAGGFPINEPVAVNSNDLTMLATMGTNNLVVDAVNAINDQLGEFQRSARLVIVRTPASSSGVAATARDENIASIVGNSTTGTGIHAFKRAGSLVNRVPRLIGAPGFTAHQATGSTANPVAAALPAVLDQLLAHAVLDTPGTTKQATLDYLETLSSDRIIAVEPGVKVIDGSGATVTRPASGRILGIAARRDHEKGGRPFHSWANQPVRGIVGPARPIEFSLTDGAVEAQEILAAQGGVIVRGEGGVADSIARGGFVYIGTDNLGTDANWRFYNVTRGRDYIHLAYLATLREYLGKYNLTGQTLQAIANTMNAELRDRQADGDIIGFRPVSFPVDQNPVESLRLGEITVLFRAEEAPVLRKINILSGRYAQALTDMLGRLATTLQAAA